MLNKIIHVLLTRHDEIVIMFWKVMLSLWSVAMWLQRARWHLCGTAAENDWIISVKPEAACYACNMYWLTSVSVTET